MHFCRELVAELFFLLFKMKYKKTEATSVNFDEQKGGKTFESQYLEVKSSDHVTLTFHDTLVQLCNQISRPLCLIHFLFDDTNVADKNSYAKKVFRECLQLAKLKNENHFSHL